MRFLMGFFLLLAVVSAVFGSMRNMQPEIVLITKITLVASTMLFLITLVGSYIKQNTKTLAR